METMPFDNGLSALSFGHLLFFRCIVKPKSWRQGGSHTLKEYTA